MARAALVALVVLVAGGALWHAFGNLDFAATARAVIRVGPLAPVALVPFSLAMGLDAAAIRVLLGVLGRRVSLSGLFRIRIATEALHVTAPAGFVVADTATATLLAARCGVPLGEGALLAVARKWLVMRAHAAYVALGAAAGATVLAAVSSRYLGGQWLPWAIGGSALVPLALSVGLGAGFRGGPTLARLHTLVSRVPWRALRERIEPWRSAAVTCDGQLAQIGAARSATWLAAAAFFGCWLLESLETAIIMRLVGGPLDFGSAMAAEVGVSMLRSIGNVVPGGLGVQDAGYATLFPAMGLTTEATAAFVLVKRGKELVWIAIGYTLFAKLRRVDRPKKPSADEELPAVSQAAPEM